MVNEILMPRINSASLCIVTIRMEKMVLGKAWI
jgi:hypothetical protein